MRKTAVLVMVLILSSCATSVSKVEPFPQFFENFKKSWQRKDMESIAGNIQFPLMLETSFEGEVETSFIQRENFFRNADISEPFMYEMIFGKESGKLLTVMYGYEAVEYTLYFNRIDGRWMLVRIRKAGC